MKALTLFVVLSVPVFAVGCGSNRQVEPVVIDLTQKSATPAPGAPPATPVSEPPAAAPGPRSATVARSTPPITPAIAASAPAIAGHRDVSPESVVDAQLAARNRGDLEALLSFYAPDAKIYDGPDQLKWSGQDDLRRHFASHLSRSPGLRATVASRMVQGNYVIQQEEFEGGAEGAGRSVVMYEVAGGHIVRVWLLH